MKTHNTNLLVIGAGINGAGIAADAAGRGLSVVLCDKGDLASATSSWSSKLIHGGLRYLEQYEFKLVHEALKEREILMQKAPFLIHPLEFILPHDTHLRPVWMIRIGLFLYDHLAKRKRIKGSKKVNLANTVYGKPLKKEFPTGFSYYDCQTDDARLVVLNALCAKQHGATVLTRTTCLHAEREQEKWKVQLHDNLNDEDIIVFADAIVNATGPWVEKVLHEVIHLYSESSIKWVQGSHIVVPKLYDHQYAYILQNEDQRIVFAIPYQEKFTLIGTTDVDYHGDLDRIEITDKEITYLCEIINHYFNQPISRENIVWSYSGVRALYDDRSDNPAKVTREYHLELEDREGRLPILSVFGGKLTTYRILAEDALTRLKQYFPKMGQAWTANSALPGAKLKGKTLSDFHCELKEDYSWLPSELVNRYVNSYGDRCLLFLQGAQSLQDLGRCFGGGLYQRELDYLLQHEWAVTIEDIIWRRSKLGLVLQPDELEQIRHYIAIPTNINIER